MSVPDDPAQLRRKWHFILQEAGRHGQVIIVLDAINQLDSFGDPSRLDWLTDRLPENVRIIVSVRSRTPSSSSTSTRSAW
jgi:hypothetical protein